VQIELELGVTRGTEWVARAVFRPPALVSIGTNSMAVLSLKEPGFPAYHELFRLHLDGGMLLFDPQMTVELKLKEGPQTTDTIIEGGLAVSTDSGWRLPIAAGSKGAVRFGDLAILFKVRARREVPLKAVRKADPTLCGTCGAPMPWAIVGFGALSPCSACATLNEVQVDTGAPEDKRTQMAPVIRKKGADLPTFDSISVRNKGAELPTFDSISVRSPGAELPTFDSISVGKHADLPTFDSLGAFKEENLRISKEDQSAPTRRMLADEQLSGPQLLEPEAPTPLPGHGADLPTFDAISAFQDQGLSATAAISALRGDASVQEPPVSLSDGVAQPLLLNQEERDTDPELSKKAVTAPMRRPVPRHAGSPPDLMQTDSAPPIHATDIVATSGEVSQPVDQLAVAKVVTDEKDFFGEEFLHDLEQQRSLVSVPILKRDVPPPPPPSRTPPPKTNGVPSGGTLPPHGSRAAPAGQGQVQGRPSGFLRNEAEPLKPGLPPLDESGAHDYPDEEEGGSEDDFLMGRSDLPSPPSSSNRWLLVIGTVAGLSGVALIVYKLVVG